MSESNVGNSDSAKRCFFSDYLKFCHIDNQFADKELTALRKQTVIVKSIDQGDSLQADLNKLLKRKNCSESAKTTPEKLLRRSIVAFEFKTV